jgi:hypothetical protein
MNFTNISSLAVPRKPQLLEVSGQALGFGAFKQIAPLMQSGGQITRAELFTARRDIMKFGLLCRREKSKN